MSIYKSFQEFVGKSIHFTQETAAPILGAEAVRKIVFETAKQKIEPIIEAVKQNPTLAHDAKSMATAIFQEVTSKGLTVWLEFYTSMSKDIGPEMLRYTETLGLLALPILARLGERKFHPDNTFISFARMGALFVIAFTPTYTQIHEVLYSHALRMGMTENPIHIMEMFGVILITGELGISAIELWLNHESKQREEESEQNQTSHQRETTQEEGLKKINLLAELHRRILQSSHNVEVTDDQVTILHQGQEIAGRKDVPANIDAIIRTIHGSLRLRGAPLTIEEYVATQLKADTLVDIESVTPTDQGSSGKDIEILSATGEVSYFS